MAATGFGEYLLAAGVKSGVALGEGLMLGEVTVGEEEGAPGNATIGTEDGALGESEGAVADCRQEAKTSGPKLEMNTSARR